MPVIPRDIAEASKWLKTGLLRPLREAQMTDNGVIIGARKATLWERFKVNFVFDNKKIQQINNVNSQAWSIFAKTQAKKLADVAITEPRADYANYHLFDKDFDLQLRRGLFPIGDRSATVTHEVEVKGKRRGFNSKKRTEQNKLFDQSAFRHNRPYWTMWSYSHSKTPLINRIPLPTFVIGEGADKVAGQHAMQSSGWTAAHYVEKEIARGTTTKVTYTKKEASFSTIPMATADVAPTELPKNFTIRTDVTNSFGVITKTNHTTWELIKKSARDIDKNGAWYRSQITFPNGKMVNAVQFFKLHEMVNQPRNIVVELQNGNKVVYAVLVNKEQQHQWYERYYFANSKKTDWKPADLNPLVWVMNNTMLRAMKDTNGESDPRKTVRFNQQQVFSYDVDTPIDQLLGSTHKSTSVAKGQKPHQQLSNSYNEEYSARLKKFNQNVNDRIENLQDEARHSILSDAQKEELADLLKTQNAARKVAEKRARFSEKAENSEEIWTYAYGKKAITREKLRPSAAIEQQMKELPIETLKLSRNHTVEGHSRVVKFSPHLMQDANWKQQVIDQFDTALIRENLITKLSDPSKMGEFIAATKIKGDRYVELFDAITLGEDALSEEEVGVGKLQAVSDVIDGLLELSHRHHAKLLDVTEKLKLANVAYTTHKGKNAGVDDDNRARLRAIYMDAENTQIELKSVTDRLNVCQAIFLQQTEAMDYDLNQEATVRTLAKRYPNVLLTDDYSNPVEHALEAITTAEESLAGIETVAVVSSEETIYEEMSMQPRGVSFTEEPHYMQPSNIPLIEEPHYMQPRVALLVKEDPQTDIYSLLGQEDGESAEPMKKADLPVPSYISKTESEPETESEEEGSYEPIHQPVVEPMPSIDSGDYKRLKQVQFRVLNTPSFVIDENIVDEIEDDEESYDEKSAISKLNEIKDNDSLSDMSFNPNYESTEMSDESDLDEKLDEAKKKFSILAQNEALKNILADFKSINQQVPALQTKNAPIIRKETAV